MSLFEDDISNLSPLLPRGVNTSGVVGTSVQKEDRAQGRRLEGLDIRLESETDSLRVVVRVGDGLDLDIFEDGKVVDYFGFEMIKFGKKAVGDVKFTHSK